MNNAAFTSSVWVGLVNLLFTGVAIALVDKAGRRPLLLVGTAVQTISLGIVGWMFHNQVGGLPLLVAVVAFIGAFAMALGPIGWLLCAEIFPNKVRGRAMSVASFTVWVSCFIVARTFPDPQRQPQRRPGDHVLDLRDHQPAGVRDGAHHGPRDQRAIARADRGVLGRSGTRPAVTSPGAEVNRIPVLTKRITDSRW